MRRTITSKNFKIHYFLNGETYTANVSAFSHEQACIILSKEAKRRGKLIIIF